MDILKQIEILRYLLEQINDIEAFTADNDEELFIRNELVKNASLMKLLVLGEYTMHVDPALKDRFSEVQWQLMKAARNYYAHMYRGIDWMKVWETVHQEIPVLKTKIEHIIEVLEREQNGKIN